MIRATERLLFCAVLATAVGSPCSPSLVLADEAEPQRHWAFVVPERPPLPRVRAVDWSRNPVDSFVLARLEAEGIAPSPRADRYTLARRLSLDLRGLPPTVEEAERFATDDSPKAYASLVDSFFADPAYGEKMASYWLDLARFGDTNGYQDDGNRVMWPYRDYVIRAFNENRPFDQFTLENIAGDLLPERTIEQQIASGFNRNHRFNEEGGSDPDEFRVVYAVDRVNTTATTWLGLTFECAQCHDHKYDPLTQKEYYQFYAFFNNNRDELGVSKAKRQPPFIELSTPEQEARRQQLAVSLEDVGTRLKELEPAVLEAMKAWRAAGKHSAAETAELENDSELARIVAADGDVKEREQRKLLRFYAKHHHSEYADLAQRLDELRRENRDLERSIVTTLIMGDMTPRRPTFVLERGDFRRQAEEVVPGVPAIFASLESEREPDRLALARWLIDPSNPLVARVAVNRIWQQLFGRGIVKTASDFGTRGDPPSHPALLDWLATELIRTGWDIKRIQRLVVTSATYRQASVFRRDVSSDPTNLWFHRAPRFRLRAEEVRDGALAVAGLLHRQLGGASFMPYQPDGYFADKSRDWRWTTSEGAAQYRRGLYTFWRRTTPHPSLVTFDAPSRELCVVDRPRTISPQQALVTLNDPVFFEAARVLAEEVLVGGPSGLRPRLVHAFRRVLTHPPGEEELEILAALYRDELQRYRADPDSARRLIEVGQSPRRSGVEEVELAAWASVANALLNLDESITRE